MTFRGSPPRHHYIRVGRESSAHMRTCEGEVTQRRKGEICRFANAAEPTRFRRIFTEDQTSHESVVSKHPPRTPSMLYAGVGGALTQAGG